MDRKKELKKERSNGGIQISAYWLRAFSTVVRSGSALLMLLIVIMIALFLYFILSPAVFKPSVYEEASEVEKTVEKIGGTEEKFINKIEHSIKERVYLDAKQNRYGETLLHLAAKKGYPKAVKLLLDNNADINVRDVMETTPLHLAVIEDKTEIVRLLIANGADLNATSNYLSTPLCIAARCGKVEIAKLLLENGADANITAKAMNTPLEEAITTLKYENFMKRNNTTPERQEEIIKILRAYGGKE